MLSSSSARAEAGRAAVAVMPLRTNTIKKKTIRVLDNLLVTAVDDIGRFDVISPQDVASMIGFEKMRDVAGCDDVACAAELAGALGSRYLFTSTIDVLGSKLLLTGTLLDSLMAKVLKRTSVEIKDSPDNYTDGIRQLVVKTFRAKFDLAEGGEPAEEETAKAAPAKAEPAGDEPGEEEPPLGDDDIQVAMACLSEKAEACKSLREQGKNLREIGAFACRHGTEDACAKLVLLQEDDVVPDLYEACVAGVHPACTALAMSDRLGELDRVWLWTGIGMIAGGAALGLASLAAVGAYFGKVTGHDNDFLGWRSGLSGADEMAVVLWLTGGVAVVSGLLVMLLATPEANEVTDLAEAPFRTVSLSPVVTPDGNAGWACSLALTF